MRLPRTACSLASFGVVLLAATALGPSRLLAQARASHPSGAQCEATGTWDAEVPLLLPGGRPAFVEPGSAEVHPLGVLALGTPSLIWLRPDRIVPPEAELAGLDTAHARWSFTRAGILVRPDGEIVPLEPPPRGGPMLDPSVRRGNSGRYHVVWAEDTLGEHTPTRLWHAQLDVRAEGDETRAIWSSPVKLATAGRLEWGEQLTNQLAGRGDTLIFAVRARDSTGSFVLVAQGEGETWRTAEFRQTWGSGYVAAGLSARGMPLLIVVGEVMNRSGLFAVELAGWDASGGSWHPPVPLDTLGGHQAVEPRLAHLGGDSLLLVFQHHADEGRGTSELRAMVSTDGGSEWRAAGELAMSGRLRGLRLLVDDGGGIHAIYVGSRGGGNVLGEPGAVQHVRWRDGQWGAGTTASSRQSFTQPLASVTSDGIMAIWGEGHLEEANMIPRSYAAWWRSSCRTGP